MTDYERQAADFLKKHGAQMIISHATECGEWLQSPMTGGYLYNVRINRNGKSWTFRFSDCKANYQTNRRPTKYSVLACIEKYNPKDYAEDMWDFAKEYGYKVTDKKSFDETERIYKAVQKEYKNVMRMFGDCIDELRTIE